MSFQIIQNDVETPYNVKNALAILKDYGYDIPERPTGKLLTQLDGVDSQIAYFVSAYLINNRFTTASLKTGIKVNYVELELLDFVAGQIASAKGDYSRTLRHALIDKYFGATATTELYRNLAGFRKAFEQVSSTASYTLRVV